MSRYYLAPTHTRPDHVNMHIPAQADTFSRILSLRGANSLMSKPELESSSTPAWATSNQAPSAVSPAFFTSRCLDFICLSPSSPVSHSGRHRLSPDHCHSLPPGHPASLHTAARVIFLTQKSGLLLAETLFASLCPCLPAGPLLVPLFLNPCLPQPPQHTLACVGLPCSLRPLALFCTSPPPECAFYCCLAVSHLFFRTDLGSFSSRKPSLKPLG